MAPHVRIVALGMVVVVIGLDACRSGDDIDIANSRQLNAMLSARTVAYGLVRDARAKAPRDTTGFDACKTAYASAKKAVDRYADRLEADLDSGAMPDTAAYGSLSRDAEQAHATFVGVAEKYSGVRHLSGRQVILKARGMVDFASAILKLVEDRSTSKVSDAKKRIEAVRWSAFEEV